MDSKCTVPILPKKVDYLERFEAWKQQKTVLANQPKMSAGKCKPSGYAKERQSNMKENKLIIGQRRETFEIPAALRNSPVPVSLLPRISRSGRPRQSAGKIRSVVTEKENKLPCRKTIGIKKPAVNCVPHCKNQVKPKARQSVSGMKPVVKIPTKVEKRRSCALPKPSTLTLSQPPTCTSLPFIRHTKTSLARMGGLPEKKDDYMEKFKKWKEDKAKNMKNNLKTNPPPKVVVTRPQKKIQSSSIAPTNPVHRSVSCKTSTLNREKETQIRRRTICDAGTKKNPSVQENNRVNRRQTVSFTSLNQRHVPGKPEDKSSSLKRKELFPGAPASKRTKLDPAYRRTPRQQSTPVPRKKKTQATLRQELEEWLKAKGKTPSRCRHLMCYGGQRGSVKKLGRPHTKPVLSEEELSQQQMAIEKESECVSDNDGETSEQERAVRDIEARLHQLLKECLDLHFMGCPVDSLLSWLDRIQSDIPLAIQSADFWVCRAKLVQSTGNTNSVLEVFEQAVRHEAKPADALAKQLTEMVKEMTTGSRRYMNVSITDSTPVTPAHQLREVQPENVFESSAIKYCVKENTPLLNRMREMYGSDGYSPCVVVTPVRRSTRRSLATIPEALQEKNRLYASIDEIPESQQMVSLYQVNPALVSPGSGDL